jgi:hypothetical protein
MSFLFMYCYTIWNRTYIPFEASNNNKSVNCDYGNVSLKDSGYEVKNDLYKHVRIICLPV